MHSYTDRDKLTLTCHLETLRNGIAAGVVYNSDYNAIKEDLNRIFDRAWISLRVWGSPINLAFDKADMPFSGSLYLIGTMRRRFNTIPAETPGRDAYEALLTEWEEYAAIYNEAKPLVIKARKPSDKERKTPLRTLENTGTCPVCGMNVKLEKGGILHAHGYTLQWNFRNGNCFAVGFQPWEKSPEGAKQYNDALKNQRRSCTHTVENQHTIETVADTSRPARRGQPYPKLSRGELGFDRALKIYIAGIESEIRMLDSTIADFDKRIATWKEEALPG